MNPITINFLRKFDLEQFNERSPKIIEINKKFNELDTRYNCQKNNLFTGSIKSDGFILIDYERIK